jgi:hypothetical protein
LKIVVAFSSPKRSANTVELAAKHAKAIDAELILLRIIPDPEKVGVVAQLISSERPVDTAQRQIDEVVARLIQQGVKASGHYAGRGRVTCGFALRRHNQRCEKTNVPDEKRSNRALSCRPLLHITLLGEKRLPIRRISKERV